MNLRRHALIGLSRVTPQRATGTNSSAAWAEAGGLLHVSEIRAGAFHSSIPTIVAGPVLTMNKLISIGVAAMLYGAGFSAMAQDSEKKQEPMKEDMPMAQSAPIKDAAPMNEATPTKEAAPMKDSMPMDNSMGMNMNPYFSTIDRPLEKNSLMLMALSDFQNAQFGNNFATGMLMAQYGITSRWTVGVMVEGQKISGMPATYGGARVSTYVHLFPDDRFLNLTLYGEYEDLNGAALYKMEVAGFGPEDLIEPLTIARRTTVRTFEQRVIVYHDWARISATFNFIRETPLQGSRVSDYGYALGVFAKPASTSGAMAGMADTASPASLSMSRLGYGVETIGALGNGKRFGFYRNTQQHYIGPVFTYDISPHCSLRLEPAFGLSKTSDPFFLRAGVAYMFGG